MYQPIRYTRIVPIRQDVILPEVVYVGPGDVVSGAVGWWGLRAYNNAAIGTNCCRVRRNSDNAEQNFATTTGGHIDKAALTSFLASTTGAFVTLFDQSGGSRDVTMATAATQPVVNLSGLGSRVTADFTAQRWDSSSSLTQSLPLTVSAVAKSTNTGAQQVLFFDNIGCQLGYRNSADNQVFQYAGSVATATASDGTFHSIQSVFNGASSDLNIDGGANAVSSGSNSFSGLIRVGIMTGQFGEVGIWPSAFSGTQSTNMDANQSAYWGF